MSKGVNRTERVTKKKQPRRKLHEFEFTSFYGAEPVWAGVSNTDEDFKLKLHYAFNWINAIYEYEQIKDEALTYLDSKKILTQGLADLPATKFAYIGKIAWLLNNGCPVPANYLNSFERHLEQLLDKEQVNDDLIVTESGEIIVKDDKPKVTRAEFKARLQENKVIDLTAMIEDVIDESVIKDVEIGESAVYHKLSSDKIDEKVVNELYDRLSSKHQLLVKELENLQKLTEEQQILQFDNAETFQDYVADVEANIDGFISSINQLASYLGNKKALKKSERKVGKHKARKIETQISKMNFKVQDETYKVMSINPASVVGAMTLLAFNTHTRKISIYVANDIAGLGVKGTTIQNFDEALSSQKIVKKPDMLKQFQEGNVRRLKVLFKDNIRAKESPVNGRINEHTILLRVYTEKYSPAA